MIELWTMRSSAVQYKQQHSDHTSTTRVVLGHYFVATWQYLIIRRCTAVLWRPVVGVYLMKQPCVSEV
eukprot:1125-Heterococcus_DN1.PRE.7